MALLDQLPYFAHAHSILANTDIKGADRELRYCIYCGVGSNLSRARLLFLPALLFLLPTILLYRPQVVVEPIFMGTLVVYSSSSYSGESPVASWKLALVAGVVPLDKGVSWCGGASGPPAIIRGLVAYIWAN